MKTVCNSDSSHIDFFFNFEVNVVISKSELYSLQFRGLPIWKAVLSL